jgi:GntR family transcriptional regulator
MKKVVRNQPLYEQVSNQIVEWIHERMMEDIELLPSETELTQLLNVSRATVREALSHLERNHVIIRRHGSGTYINPAIKQIYSSVEVLSDPIALIEKQGYRASLGRAEASWGRIDGPAHNLPEGQPCVSYAIQYLASHHPAILMKGNIFIHDGDDHPPSASDSKDLLQFVEDTLAVKAAYSLTIINATIADAFQAEWLDIKPNHPLLCFEETQIAHDNQTIGFSRSYFTPGIITLQLIRNKAGVPGQVSIW